MIVWVGGEGEWVNGFPELAREPFPKSLCRANVLFQGVWWVRIRQGADRGSHSLRAF